MPFLDAHDVQLLRLYKAACINRITLLNRMLVRGLKVTSNLHAAIIFAPSSPHTVHHPAHLPSKPSNSPPHPRSSLPTPLFSVPPPPPQHHLLPHPIRIPPLRILPIPRLTLLHHLLARPQRIRAIQLATPELLVRTGIVGDELNGLGRIGAVREGEVFGVDLGACEAGVGVVDGGGGRGRGRGCGGRGGVGELRVGVVGG